MKHYSTLITALTTGLFTLCTLPVQAQLKQPFLWELSKGDKIITLFGSLHIGKADFYPLPESIQSRFNAAQILAIEADVSDPKTQAACDRLAATRNKIDSIISADDRVTLANYIKAANVDLKIIEDKKLWMVNLVLTALELTQLGVDFNRGIDINLLRQARTKKKHIAEIEGGEKQCATLAAATDTENAAALSRFLATVRDNRMENRINDMIHAYRNGDGATLLKITNEEFGNSKDGLSIRKRIFDDRHPAMAQVIEHYFNDKNSYFVVIGVGHMLGDNNLLETLEKRGIKVKPL